MDYTEEEAAMRRDAAPVKELANNQANHIWRATITQERLILMVTFY
jgi:hypothetical protein